MADTDVSVLDPRGRETRARLLLAAAAVLQQGGYAAASVVAIAEHAGVATGTLYRHFPSKAELFVELFRSVGDGELAAMNDAAASSRSYAEELDAVVATFAGRALANPRLAWALVYEPVDAPVDVERIAYRRAYAARLAEFIRAGVESGELPDQDPDISAAALIGGIAEALVSPLAPVAGPNADPDAVVTALTELCRRAIGATS